MKTKNTNEFESHVYTEKVLLSSIITNMELEAVKDELTPDDFYDSKCREVYKAMLKLEKDNSDTHVENQLIHLEDLVISLGNKYTDFLLELAEMHAFNYELYLKKVKENSTKRKKDWYINQYKNNAISENELIKILNSIESETKEVKFRAAVNLPMLESTERKSVFGFNIEYSSICLIAGATGTGKTEFTMEIADVHAKSPKSLSILCYFEGNEKHIQERLRRKNISNENLLYAIKPSFKDIRKILQNNKDKKVFLVIDYIQKLARHMRVKDKRPTDILMIYIDKLFEYFDDLRNEFPNVCICFLASYSKAGISEMKAEKLPDMVSIANGIKESGDIAYDVDYGYAMFFADEDEKFENKWSIGRKIKGKYRNYVLMYGFKDSRIDGDLPENIYQFNNESKRYNLTGTPDIKNNDKNMFYDI
jgi:uridine kinase